MIVRKFQLVTSLIGVTTAKRGLSHIVLVLILYSAFVLHVAASDRRINTANTPSGFASPLEIAQSQPVDFRDPHSIDLVIALYHAALIASDTPHEKRSVYFGLLHVLRLADRNLEEQNSISRSLFMDSDWTDDESVEAALDILDLHIFDLQHSPLRDLKFAEEVAIRAIDHSNGRERFALRYQAKVNLMRIRCETKGPQAAISFGKLCCLEVSQAIEDGIIDPKRNPSPRQRISNGAAIDNLGLYVPQLILQLESQERAEAMRDLNEFIIECRLNSRIAGALRTGLENCRN
jgi:hypothetical protein